MTGNTEVAGNIAAVVAPLRHSHGYTDFSSFSHQDLYSMLFASDPATVREAAAAWQSTGRMLADQAARLTSRLANFHQVWQGKAADEYHVMITDLATGLDKVSNNALAMNNLMSASAEALDKARAAMPPPQVVPDLDPTVLAAATAAPPPEIAMMPGAQAQFATGQLQAQQAVQAHQAQLDSAATAKARAVQVMQALGAQYGGTEDAVPATPQSVGPVPGGPTDSGGSGVPMTDPSADMLSMAGPSPVVGSPATTDGSSPAGVSDAALLTGAGASATSPTSAAVPASPLFGHMFTAGLAAASAAAAGRFGSVMPRLPGFLNTVKGKKAAGTSTKTAAVAGRSAAAAAAARTAALKLGGAGSGSLGSGSLGSGSLGSGASSAPAATAYSGLIGGSGSAGVTGAAAAGQLAGAAAGSTGSTGTSMPMMPMGGMAGAGGGDLGGKRIPPWLVETEDVWGESSAVSPPVIGEDF